MLERTITQTAIALGDRYGRCAECGHVQRVLAPPCLKCDGDQVQVVAGPGVPEGPRRAAKAEGTVVGKVLVGVGGALLALAGVVAILTLLRAGELGWVHFAIAGLFAGPGVFVLALGASLISREAAPAIDRLGNWAVRILRAIRGKNGTSPARAPGSGP